MLVVVMIVEATTDTGMLRALGQWPPIPYAQFSISLAWNFKWHLTLWAGMSLSAIQVYTEPLVAPRFSAMLSTNSQRSANLVLPAQ